MWKILIWNFPIIQNHQFCVTGSVCSLGGQQYWTENIPKSLEQGVPVTRKQVEMAFLSQVPQQTSKWNDGNKEGIPPLHCHTEQVKLAFLSQVILEFGILLSFKVFLHCHTETSKGLTKKRDYLGIFPKLHPCLMETSKASLSHWNRWSWLFSTASLKQARVLACFSGTVEKSQLRSQSKIREYREAGGLRFF